MRRRLATVPRHRLLLGAILALALCLRLFRLDSVPVGINGDELFNAIDAGLIGRGSWPIFFPGNQGREAFFLYLMAASMGLLGKSIVAFRLPAVLLGTGAVLLGYLLGRDLFSRRVGLLAAAVTAVSLWPLMHSRWGLRAVSLTFCTGLALFWLNRAARGGRLRDWLLGGLAGGLVLYSYLPGRLFPLVVLGWLVWLAATQRDAIRTGWRGALLGLLLALLVFAPFGRYMQQNPDLVNQRVNSMTASYRTALDGEFGPLRESVTAVLRMFSFEGDAEWRYHVSGRPLFDPISSLFFYLGAGLSLWFAFRPPADPARGRAPDYALLWLWAGAMLAPNALLDANPSFLRAAGAVLPLYLMLAVGADAVWRWLQPRLPAGSRGWLLPGLAAAGVLLTLVGTWRAYFDVWANDPTVRDVYQGDLAMMGRFVAQSDPAAARIFIAHPYAYDAAPRTVSYYTDRGVSWFTPAASFVAPAAGAAWYLVPLDAALPLDLPAGARETAVAYPNGDPAFRLIQYDAPPALPAAQQTALPTPAGPELTGVSLPDPLYRGESVPLTLRWRLPAGQQPQPTRLTSVVVRLEDVQGREWARSGTLLGYPQASWRGGDSIWQTMMLELPAGFPPGSFTLRVNLVDPDAPEPAAPDLTLGPYLARGRPLPEFAPAADDLVFGGALVLTAATLSTLVEPGLGVDIALDWMPLARLPADYRVQFELLQPDNPAPILTQTDDLLPGMYPPSAWRPLEPVRSLHRLAVPPDLPTEARELALRVRLLAAGDAVPVTQGDDRLAAMTLLVRERLFTAPPMDQPLAAQFGPAVRLLGYSLDAGDARPGGSIGLTLVWQAIDTPADDYTIFTHLIRPDGQLAGQFDSPPVGAAWLMRTWQPGEVVVEQRRIPIRPDAPAGELTIVVGLYTVENGRLPVTRDGAAQPGDQLPLATVVVGTGGG